MKNVVGFSSSGNLHLALSRLQEDGEEALVALARSVAKGEPLVRCQLLASIFYEELRRQLRQCPRMDNPERAVLVNAADYCGRAAITCTTPPANQCLRLAPPTHLGNPDSLRPGRAVAQRERPPRAGLSKIRLAVLIRRLREHWKPSASCATKQESHRPQTVDQAVLHRRWGREPNQQTRHFRQKLQEGIRR
jgi:hypothetical protein